MDGSDERVELFFFFFCHQRNGFMYMFSKCFRGVGLLVAFRCFMGGSDGRVEGDYLLFSGFRVTGRRQGEGKVSRSQNTNNLVRTP